MPSIANPSVEQLAAASLYGWYEGHVETREAGEDIARWIAGSESEIPLSAGEIFQSLLRTKGSQSFPQQREALLTRWREPMTRCGENPDQPLAERILNDWLESSDHNLIFSHAVFAGTSRVRAHQVGDATTYLYGKRDYWTLHLIMEGGVIYTADRDIIGVPGDLVLIEPSAHCHYRRHPKHAQWCHAWVIFTPKPELLKWMKWPGAGERMYRVNSGDGDAFKKMDELLRQIRETLVDESSYRDDLCLNLLEQLFIRVNRTSLAQQLGSLDSRVAKACEYLRRQLEIPLTVKEIADHCNVSTSRISHLFKEEMGMGLQEYRNRLRMQNARNLLVTTRLPVSAIALKTGYSDPSQFSKYFHRQNGCSPRQFRSQYRQSSRGINSIEVE